VNHLKVRPIAPTGIYFKVRGRGSREVLLLPCALRASHMAPGDVPDQRCNAPDKKHPPVLGQTIEHGNPQFGPDSLLHG
jgi:hypothetical protein